MSAARNPMTAPGSSEPHAGPSDLTKPDLAAARANAILRRLTAGPPPRVLAPAPRRVSGGRALGHRRCTKRIGTCRCGNWRLPGTDRCRLHPRGPVNRARGAGSLDADAM